MKAWDNNDQECAYFYEKFYGSFTDVTPGRPEREGQATIVSAAVGRETEIRNAEAIRRNSAEAIEVSPRATAGLLGSRHRGAKVPRHGGGVVPPDRQVRVDLCDQRVCGARDEQQAKRGDWVASQMERVSVGAQPAR